MELLVLMQLQMEPKPDQSHTFESVIAQYQTIAIPHTPEITAQAVALQ